MKYLGKTNDIKDLSTKEYSDLTSGNYINSLPTMYDDYQSNGVYFYADGMPPTTDSFGRDGFHYVNDYGAEATVGQKKINWYFYNPARITKPYYDLKNAWALVTLDKTKNPFFYVYGTTNGFDVSSKWVFSTHSASLVVGKTYLIWFGSEAPSADLFPNTPRVELTYTSGSSTGTRNENEIIFGIAYTTNSNEAANTIEFQTYALGYKVATIEEATQLAMHSQSGANNVNATIVGTPTVNIGTMPAQTVTVNEVGIKTTQNTVKIDGASSDTDGITTLAVKNAKFNTLSTTLSGTDNNVKATIVGTPTVEITNDAGNPIPVNGTVSVSTGLVDANYGKPIFQIRNEINEFGTVVPVQTLGTMAVSQMPTVEISNDSGNPITVSGTVTVSNPTTSVDVSGSNVNATITNSYLSPVNVQHVGNISSIVKGINTGYGVDATADNALKVDGSAVTQPISGTVTVANPTTSVSITGSPTVKIDGTTNTVKIAADQTIGISGTPSVNATITNTSLPVTGTFYQQTQPVSLASVPTHAVTLDTSANTVKLDTSNNSVKIVDGAGDALAIDASGNIGVNVQGTPSVTLSGSSNAVNATIIGTPTVQTGTNQVRVVRGDGASNTIPVAVSGAVSVTGTVGIDGGLNTVKITSSGGATTIPVSATISKANTKIYSQSIGTTASLQQILIAPTAGTKIRVYSIHITGQPPSSPSGTVVIGFNGGETFFRTRHAVNNVFDRSFYFGQDGYTSAVSNRELYVITTATYATGNLDLTIVYEEV